MVFFISHIAGINYLLTLVSKFFLMTYNIKQIEGIGETYGERLAILGINTTAELLEMGATKSGRQQIAKSADIPESLVLTWVNHADLMRIDGVAGHFSELMEASGVDTVKELGHRNAENLHIKMTEVNNKYGLTGKVPSAEQLAIMIEQAKKLEPKVFY
jgi:Domain of unknown function (DUF4332)